MTVSPKHKWFPGLVAWLVTWLVWRMDGFRVARTALTLFLIQLVVNALRSWLFFGWHRGALAFADILLLWSLIMAMLTSFWRARPLAGALLVPYLLRVSFAPYRTLRSDSSIPGCLADDRRAGLFHRDTLHALLSRVALDEDTGCETRATTRKRWLSQPQPFSEDLHAA